MFFATIFGDQVLESWFNRMLIASWQGGLFLVLAWLISQYWKTIPASTRCWIWRLAYAKFALILLFGCFVNIPVFSSPNDSGGDLQASAPAVAFSDPPKSEARYQIVEGNYSGNEISGVSPSGANQDGNWEITSWFLPVCFSVWLLVCTAYLVLFAVQYNRTRKFVRRSRPLLNAGFLHHYRELCFRMKIWNPPKIRLCKTAGSPMIAGIFRPVILMPEHVFRTCDIDELKLILAHELAHAKRRDLIWNWLPTLVNSFFFFHPMVWLAKSRLGLDQEIACDHMALEGTRSRNSTYGITLIKLASSDSHQRIPRLAAIGVASSFKTLRKRITEMGEFSNQRSQQVRLFSMGLLVAGLIAAAPIDLVAQKKVVENEKTETETNPEKIGASESTPAKQSKSSTRITKKKNLLTDEPSTAKSVASKKMPANLSVSVSEDGITRSIRVKSRTNGTVEVAYTKEVEGDKKIQKYVLGDFEKLADKNKEAYEFYKEHVSDVQKSDRSGKRRIGQTAQEMLRGIQGLPQGKQSSNSSSQGSASAAWESSTSTSRNGVTKTTRNSGVSGDGAVGGGNPQLMIDQINKMIEKTDDPNMKAQLRRMIEMIKK